MNLEELRIEVDNANKDIIKAISKRFLATRKIGELKAKSNLSSVDKNRENIVIENVRLMAKENNLDEDMMERIFRIIMTEVVKEHNKIKENN